MKKYENSKFYSFLIFLCCILLGCEKDEDNAPSTTPENNNSVNQDALIGTWKLFEIKGEDGKLYGLNEWLPLYDTIEGCQVLKGKVKHIKEIFTFRTDGLATLDYKEEYQVRSFLVQDSTNCTITYFDWDTGSDEDFVASSYSRASTNRLVFDTGDTINFQLINNILYIDNDKFRK